MTLHHIMNAHSLQRTTALGFKGLNQMSTSGSEQRRWLYAVTSHRHESLVLKLRGGQQYDKASRNIIAPLP